MDPLLSLEDVSKDYPPPSPMRVQRFFARFGGLQIAESPTTGVIAGDEFDDDEFDDDDVTSAEPMPDQSGAGHRVIDRVSLQAHGGSVVGLVGPEAAGKTMLLKLIAGIVPPSEGRIVVRGSVAPALSLLSGLLPTKGHTIKSALPAVGALVGIPHAAVRARLDEIGEFLESPQIKRAPTSTMEARRKREVILATMLSLEPNVLLIDIPLPRDRFGERCRARIAELRDRGTLVIVETRNLRKTLLTADRVVYVDRGRVVDHDGLAEASNGDQ